MLKTIITYLITQLPDTVKIVLATLVIAVLAVSYMKLFQISEIKAYVDPIQSVNNSRFESMVKHSDHQFQLLRDDINSLRQQNTVIIDKLVK